VNPALPEKRRRFLVILFATSLLSSYALGFRPRVHPLERGIDASYLFAASYASENGLRWGRDFISTFGPYCYLIYAADVGEIRAKRLGAELILVVLVAMATTFYMALRGPRGLRTALPFSFLLIYAVHVQGNSVYGDEYRWFTLLLLVLLSSIHDPSPRRFATFFTGAVLAGFFILVKLSLGVGAILSLSTACVLFRAPLAVCTGFAALGVGTILGFSVGWFAHQGTLEGISRFSTAALQVVSGYSSAMSLSPENWGRMAICIGAFVLLLMLWGLRARGNRERVTLLAFVTPLFIAWKHAMVRQDALHVAGFVLTGLFVVSVLLVESLMTSRRSGTILLASSLPALFAPWLFFADAPNLTDRLLAPFHFRWDRTPESHLEKLRLSGEARERIGKSPVDVYPWESVYVAANDLNWRNRPSPASFATFTPALDAMNSQFFTESDRPAYLLWNLEPGVHSVDGRHLFWDEPQTLRAILTWYRLSARDTAFLLEAVPRAVLSPPRPFRVVKAELGDWIPVPDSEGDAVLASLVFARPWWVGVGRALLREDPVFITVRFDSEDTQTYRFVPDQAASGLWVSPLPRDLSELGRILRGQYSQPRVQALRLDGARGGEEKSPVVVTWLRVRPL
jgi:hypothetical protein